MKFIKMERYDGLALAIAWPETPGKQPGSWYDTPMRWIGINRNYYYRAGHAAIVLVKYSTGMCHYFDFGRYHAPFQYGRVRNVSTDSDLYIHTKAVLQKEKIINIHEILHELQNNSSCHGGGTLYASYGQVNFESAWLKAKEMQSRGVIPFCPFRFNGSNCCRFVRTIILAGKPALNQRFKLRFLWPFTPVPIGNVNSLANKVIIPENEVNTDHVSANKNQRNNKTTNLYDRYNVKGTLPAPVRPDNLASASQWLSGEGAGSWFHLEPED
jgi:hypothetical protein